MGRKILTAIITLLGILPIFGTGCPQPKDTTIRTAEQSALAYPPTITVSYDFDNSGNWVEP